MTFWISILYFSFNLCESNAIIIPSNPPLNNNFNFSLYSKTYTGPFLQTFVLVAAVPPSHLIIFPFNPPVNTFPKAKVTLTKASLVILPKLPFLPLIFLPLILKYLICFEPTLTNSSLLIHAISKTRELSTLTKPTNEGLLTFDVSKTAIELLSSSPLPTNLLPSGENFKILIALSNLPFKLLTFFGIFSLSLHSTFVSFGKVVLSQTNKLINLASPFAAIWPVATVRKLGCNAKETISSLWWMKYFCFNVFLSKTIPKAAVVYTILLPSPIYFILFLESNAR